MDQGKYQNDAIVEAYDNEAEASGWFGPEVVFGLAYTNVQPGQSILDIGIGTGLGSVLFQKAGLKVHGTDISPRMLDACRSKGFTALQLHDLSTPPYPYDSESMDHTVCVGVLILSAIYRQCLRKPLVLFAKEAYLPLLFAIELKVLPMKSRLGLSILNQKKLL
jgi:SAM-dependent methyltransferase